MMERRIKIGDVWYVREDSIPTQLLPTVEVEEPTHTESLIWENRKYCFIVSRSFKQVFSNETYDDVDIESTDKRFETRKEWVKEYWDNDNWFRGVLEGNMISIAEIQDSMCGEGIAFFRGILQYLVDNEWLKQ